MKASIILVLTLVVLAASVEGQKANKRCKYFEWARGCKLSCKVLGHTTGELNCCLDLGVVAQARFIPRIVGPWVLSLLLLGLGKEMGTWFPTK